MRLLSNSHEKRVTSKHISSSDEAEVCYSPLNITDEVTWVSSVNVKQTIILRVNLEVASLPKHRIEAIFSLKRCFFIE